MVRWGRIRKNGNPCREEDLGEIEFVDVLRDIAEEGCLCPCLDVVFTGTEETAEEADASDEIDAVVVKEHRGDDFDAVREAVSLDAMPLSGMLKSEREWRGN